MDNSDVITQHNLKQQISRLSSRKKELKEKIRKLQEFAKQQFVTIEILQRRIKKKYDLTTIRGETIRDLIREKSRILEQLNLLEKENTELKIENRTLKRATCCHRNEC